MLAAADPVLRIHGEAVARGLDLVRARLEPSRLLAVVKDDAYGHGMGPIAGASWCCRVRRWTVSRARSVPFGIQDLAAVGSPWACRHGRLMSCTS